MKQNKMRRHAHTTKPFAHMLVDGSSADEIYKYEPSWVRAEGHWMREGGNSTEEELHPQMRTPAESNLEAPGFANRKPSVQDAIDEYDPLCSSLDSTSYMQNKKSMPR